MMLRLIFLSVFILQIQIWAEKGLNPVGPVQPNLAPDNQNTGSLTPVRTSPSHTVDEASRMLQSLRVEDRVGAAKLLGKYPGTQVCLLLVGALDDSSELVRRASVVSLVEQFNNGSFFNLGQPIYEKVFSKIGDSDVEVRREISGLIPRLAFRLVPSLNQRTLINGRMVYRTQPGYLRKDLRELANQAFRDTDPVVRQNMLKYHSSLRLVIGPDVLSKLLEDRDKGVLLEAIEQAQRYGSFEEIQKKFSELTQYPEVGVRIKLCKAAHLLSRSISYYRSILSKLSEDQASEVATLAILDLARLGQKISPSMINRVVNYLINAKGFFGHAENLFFSLPVLGSDALKVYKALLSHPSAKLRSESWAKYLLMVKAWEDPALWQDGLRDSDPQVREVILFTLRGRVQQAGVGQLDALLVSEYPEVRAFGAELLLVARDEVVRDKFFDFLIDENTLVRTVTLRVLAKRKFGNWVDLHVRSLSDDDLEIQKAAGDGLLGNPKEGLPLIKKFIQESPSTEISVYLQNELRKAGFSP